MLAKVFILLIRVYQLTLSKLILYTLGPVCRFEPSCSRYAVACLRDHGAVRGGLLSIKRLCRCHPFHPGGYDPPPPPPSRGGGPLPHEPTPHGPPPHPKASRSSSPGAEPHPNGAPPSAESTGAERKPGPGSPRAQPAT